MKTHTTLALAAASLLTLGATGLAAEAATAAGAVGGPIEHYAQVPAYSTDSYRLRFQAGELAAIDIIGDGDTDLDCFVYDASGNLIELDDDGTDHCVLRWIPTETQTFRLEISNLGLVYNAYVLLATEPL
jgi:hypothetical protein